MKKNKQPVRRPPVAAVKTTPPPKETSRVPRFMRYGAYALLVIAAVGLRFWLKGPDIPLPPLDDLEPRAVEEIENARAEIWSAPRRPEKWGRLGMLLAAHSFSGEAVQCFERAEALDKPGWKWPYLRSIAQEEVDQAAALDSLREAAVAAGDDDPFPRLLLVERLMEAGDVDEASRHLRIAVHNWPNDPRAGLNQARLLFESGDFDGALAALKPALGDRHSRRAAHQLLVQIHARRADNTAAAAAAAQLSGLPADAPWPDHWRDELEAFCLSRGAFIARINKLRRRGDDEALARAAGESIERYPDLAHLVAGRERLSRGDLLGAEAALRESLRLEPRSVDALISLGDTLLRQDKFTAAADCYRQATLVEPAHGEAHLRLGEALVRLGKHDAALPSFRTAVELMPTSADAHRALADALLTNGNAAEADEHRKHADRLSKTTAPH